MAKSPYSNSEKNKNRRAFTEAFIVDLKLYFNNFFNKLAQEESANKWAQLRDSESNKPLFEGKLAQVITQRAETWSVRNIADRLERAIEAIVNNATAALQTTAQNVMNRLGITKTSQAPILNAVAQATQNTVPTLQRMLPSQPGKGLQRPVSHVNHAGFRQQMNTMYNNLNTRFQNCETTDKESLFVDLAEYANFHGYAESIHQQVASAPEAQREQLFADAFAVYNDPQFRQEVRERLGRPLFNEISASLESNNNFARFFASRRDASSHCVHNDAKQIDLSQIAGFSR